MPYTDSSYNDSDASLASQLRSASRTPSSISRARGSRFASSKLTSEDDEGYGNRLASTANAYSRALLSQSDTPESRRARDFASSLSRPSSSTRSHSRLSRLSRWTSRLTGHGRRGRSSRRRHCGAGGSSSGLSHSLTRDTRELISVGAVGPAIVDLARTGRYGTIDNLHAHLASLVDTGTSRSRTSTLPSYRSYEAGPPSYTPTRRSTHPISSASPLRSAWSSGQSGTSPRHSFDNWRSSSRQSVYELDSTPISVTPSPTYPNYATPPNSRPTTPTVDGSDHRSPHSNISPGLTSTRSPATTFSNPASPVTRTLSNPSLPTRASRSDPSSRSQNRVANRRRCLNHLARSAPFHPTQSATQSEIDRLTSSINSAAFRAPPGTLLRNESEFTRSSSQARNTLYLARSSDALSRIRPSTLDALSSLRNAAVQSSGYGYGAPGQTYSALSEYAEQGSVPAFYTMRPKLERVRKELESLDPMELGEFISELQDIQQGLVWRQQLAAVSSASR